MFNPKRMLKRATLEIKKMCRGNLVMFEATHKLIAVICDDMFMFYNTGKRHKEAGRKKWSCLNFVAAHNDLHFLNENNEIPKKIQDDLINMLYSAYCDGYDRIER